MSDLSPVPQGYTRHFITVGVEAPSELSRESVVALTQRTLRLGESQLLGIEDPVPPAEAALLNSIIDLKVLN